MNINIDMNILKYKLFFSMWIKSIILIHNWLLVEPNARSSQGKSFRSSVVSIYPCILKVINSVRSNCNCSNKNHLVEYI